MAEKETSLTLLLPHSLLLLLGKSPQALLVSSSSDTRDFWKAGLMEESKETPPSSQPTPLSFCHQAATSQPRAKASTKPLGGTVPREGLLQNLE